MNSTRREFLRRTLGGSAFLTFSGAVPGFLSSTALAAGSGAGKADRVLVVIQLSGGNDGLNTVVPFEDDAYHRARPTLRMKPEQVHKLEAGLGLHPEMPAFLRLYREGHLSIVQGVGYPNSNRDHGPAMRDWHTAKPTEESGRSGSPMAMMAGDTSSSSHLTDTGWVGRALDCLGEFNRGVPGLFAGRIRPPWSVRSERVFVPAVRGLDSWLLSPPGGPDAESRFAQDIAELAGVSRADATEPLLEFARRVTLEACAANRRLEAVLRERNDKYPGFPLARTLRTIAELMRADLGVRMYFAELGGGEIGGFDTHAGQAMNHGALLRELSESVAAFLDDLRRDGLLDSVLVMTFSEFGRTLTENGRHGTGHGAAAPMFVAGGKVKGGLVGAHPSLTQLDNDAPPFHTDFRRVYATVLESWLELDSEAVLGPKFGVLTTLV